MVRVGIVGIGFMGWIHWLAYQKNPNVQVTAICTPEPERRDGDWTAIKGNFGPQGQRVDLSEIQVFEKMENLIACSNVDVVDICLPPALHVPAICAAAEAGKTVFCEKPLALDTDDCQLAVDTCARAEKNLYIGHVLPFFPEYRAAKEAIDSKRFGKLLGGHFKRVISDPTWLKGFYDPQKIGGPMLDLHVHDAHFIRYAFGMPSTVFSKGRTRGQVVEYVNSVFAFDDPEIVVSCASGVINQQGRPFTHGYEIHFENATMQFEFAGFADGSELMPLKILHEDGSVEYPELGDGDPVHAFEAEIDEVVRCVEAGEPSEILAGKLAENAIRICRAQTASVFSQQLTTIQ